VILEQRARPGLLSFVIPCYNEEAVLPLLRDELSRFIPTLGLKVEVILVDDGSSDKTLPFLLDWAAQDPAIKVLVLARNFGHQNASTAGLNAATGDVVVLLDADLQDPLEVVHEMVAKYCEGYDVVYGQRLSREGESPFKLFTAWAFYRLMRAFIHPNLPPDTGDFRLISRRCLDAVCSMHEVNRFLRGMVAWVGFLQTRVLYHRKPRAAGSTKYTLWKMLRFASNAIVSFTPLPLRISLVGGFLVAMWGLLYGVYAAWLTIFYPQDAVHGWSSQIIFTCVLGGAILVSNGILGEYIGRCFEELKGRPLYVVAHRVNFTS
jgi:glycosyltransferase involved in cell wall biosynthesis